jgi:DNA-directed RNA polymerase subunit omega
LVVGPPAPGSAATTAQPTIRIPSPQEHTVSGTVAAPIGITDPPIDKLLERADSKYALVIYSAKRARQINAYYSQLNEGLLEYVGPLVETRPQEKPLSIAMREINEGLLTITPTDS